MALLRQAVHHAPGAEDVAVDRRHGRRDHHDVEHGRRRADAQAVEDLHERAALAANLWPWVDRHQHKQGQHVEQQDPQGHRIDRPWNHPLWVLGFTGSDTDDLDAAECEHHHRQGGNHTADAIRHETTVGPQVAQAGSCFSAGRADAEEHDAKTAEDHRDDGGDFQQRQPELHLAEDLDVAQVQPADQQHDAQHPDPACDFREPEAHVDAEGGDVGQADDDHLEGVGPAEDEAGHGAQVGAGVMAKGARDRVVDGHLAEGAHDHEDGGTTNQVGQQHGGAGHLDGRGGTVEKPGADRRPQCHEANMSGG